MGRLAPQLFLLADDDDDGTGDDDDGTLFDRIEIGTFQAEADITTFQL
jgi:hypothetical protein